MTFTLINTAFTVEFNQDGYSGFEGDSLDIRVRLEGQIFGSVGVRLRLMTETQFINSGLAPAGFFLSDDPAEGELNRSCERRSRDTFSGGNYRRRGSGMV